MSNLSRDTSEEAERIQFRIWREMPGWRKLELAGQMTATVRTLALAGLRNRYPHASEAELKRRLFDLTLGPELAAKAYGPLVEEGAPGMTSEQIIDSKAHQNPPPTSRTTAPGSNSQ